MIVSDILNATPRPTLARLVLVQPDQLHAWVIEKRVAAVILKWNIRLWDLKNGFDLSHPLVKSAKRRDLLLKEKRIIKYLTPNII